MVPPHRVPGCPVIDLTRERGQAALLLLGVLAALLAGTLILFGLGQALGARAKHQRAADLAAISAAQVMRDLYPRLFEPPFIEPGVPNPRHLEEAEYRELAVAAAVRGAERNGVRLRGSDVSFSGTGFGPTRVTVRVGGEVRVRLGGDERARVPAASGDRAGGRIPIRASATAELRPDAGGDGLPEHAMGGGYNGPLAYRQGKPMRPDVALAFDRMAAAAREGAALFLSISSGFRSDAEQATLFAAHPDPKWVAPPGESLHRYATQLDLGPEAAYAWLAANASRFGFVQRYSWEAWHYGLPLAHKSLATSVGAERAPEEWPCGGPRARPLYPPRPLLRMPPRVTAEFAARLPRSQAAGALSSAEARGYTGKVVIIRDIELPERPTSGQAAGVDGDLHEACPPAGGLPRLAHTLVQRSLPAMRVPRGCVSGASAGRERPSMG